MRLFKCQACGNILYFENRTCERCGHRLAYMPEATALSALEPVDNDRWQPLAALEQQLGLRLEKTRGSVQAFVIDHVERPSAN